MDVLFKPRVEATQQKRRHKTEHFAIQELMRAQNRV